MDDAALVDRFLTSVGLSADLDDRWLPGLLVVFDPSTTGQYPRHSSRLEGTYVGAILKLSPPRMAWLRWVKNSVLSKQLINGSDS